MSPSGLIELSKEVSNGVVVAGWWAEVSVDVVVRMGRTGMAEAARVVCELSLGPL